MFSFNYCFDLRIESFFVSFLRRRLFLPILNIGVFLQVNLCISIPFRCKTELLHIAIDFFSSFLFTFFIHLHSFSAKIFSAFF